jgi:hypothetical protein
LRLSRRLRLIEFSRASSRVKWLKVDKTDVSRTISVLVLRETEVDCNPVHVIYKPARLDWITAHFIFPEDEDGDGPRNVVIFIVVFLSFQYCWRI